MIFHDRGCPGPIRGFRTMVSSPASCPSTETALLLLIRTCQL